MKLILSGSCWLLSSAFLSTWANTAFLRFFRDSLLHTVVRFVGAMLLGSMILLPSGVLKFSELPSMMRHLSVPGALLWIANYANSVALAESGITLTYVVKSSIPVITVAICAVRGERFSPMIYVSLIPICMGVALVSGTDLDFSYFGFAAAVTSAVAQTLMNISIKQIRVDKGYSGPKSFFVMSIICSLASIPLMGFMDEMDIDSSSSSPLHTISLAVAQFRQGYHWPIILIITAAMAYYTEYSLNFIVVGLLSPVMFSVADICRRLGIILIGAMVFRKTLTPMNCFGIAIAMGGVSWYSSLERLEQQKKQVSEGDRAYTSILFTEKKEAV